MPVAKDKAGPSNLIQDTGAQSNNGASSFCKYLDLYAGKRVYFHRLEGNHGDKLIEHGAEFILQKSNVITVDDAADADLIFINGGGNFNIYWCGALDAALMYRQKYNHANIVVGPQSYSFDASMRSKLTKLVQSQPDKLVLFARELTSLGILKQEIAMAQKAVSVQLSQDLAFELANSKMLAERKMRCDPEHILVAFRSDVESPFSKLRRVANIQRYLEWNHHPRLAIGLTKCIRRMLELANQRVGVQIAKRQELDGKLPILSIDSSAKGTFEDFLGQVERAQLVITDRLHIAIYAHLLGTPLIVVVGDQFHKVEGVCRMCMSGPNSRTRMVDVKGLPVD